MSKATIGFILFLVLLTAAGFWWYVRDTGHAAMGIDIGDADRVALGKSLYARECAACHGKNLEGQTRDWRQRLPDGTFPAPPHDASGHTWHHPDMMLFEVTKFGSVRGAPRPVGSNMPAFAEKLTDEEIWAVLSYIKSRWPESVRRRHDMINRRHRAAH